jgi:hypothetical protein
MRYKIYSKDGSTVRCETEKLEYNGQFMGENSVIVSAKSPKHIDFNIDDYVVFRGENFYLANIPTEKKTGDRNTKGDVFQYDNMKFMSVQYELNNADFNDFVGGSQTDISFTAQPNFSFVAATVTDLAQRIQVNMDRYYTGDKKWTIKVDNNYTTSDDNLNKLITISNITCWGALALFKSLYDTNFIVRGRTVTIGGSGSIKDITFKVGAYKGLWDMTRNSQTDQGIVTKLTSYGNTTNIHPRYYSLIGVTVTAKLTAFDHIASSYSLFFLFDLNHTTELNDTVKFNISGSSTSYELQGTWGIYKDYTFGCRGMVESFAAYKVDTTSAIYEDVRAKVLSVGYANTSVTFVSGARKDNISDLSHLSFDVNSKLPNNMNIMNLMLPAFPTQTLAEWVEENKSKYSWLQEYVNQGYTFSTERFYPCIYSKNKDVLGIRPHTEYFTSDDATHKDIYPSLQYFSDNRNQIISVVNADGTPITDEGLFQNGQTPQQIKITIHNLGFNFSEVKMGSTDPKLHMNSGYCGGRDFTIKGYSLDNIILTCDRVKDDSLGKYFPNVNSPLSNGDKFVITDIYMPTTYIDQASVTLLKWSLKWLAKNDYSVFSYQLTPDINFIKRHDDKITDKGTTFYRTVKEGDILLIEDTDIGVTGSITIDQIKITEGDGLLPKYEITLRDTKTVGTVQKIQQQIDAIVSGGVSGGYNSTQVGEIAYSALKDKFLSKVSADTAAGLITFLKGLKLGSNGMGIDENGNAILDSISKLCSLVSSKFSLNSEGGFKFWEQDGHSYGQIDYLTVMVKQMVKSLSILHIDFISGSLAVNRAGNEITRVEMVDSAGAVVTAVASAYAYRCYFTIKDNTTTNKNRWVIGDMVRCQTFSVETGAQYLSGYDKFYWRLAVGLGVVGDEGYVDLSVSSCADKSDAPAAGDKMIQYGWMDTDLSDGVTHPERQGLIMLDIDNLAIVIYEGIGTNGWSTTGCDKNVFSPFGTKVDASQISIRTGSGVSVRQPCDRGAWATGTTAYFYDRFSYGGDLWLCIDGSSAGTTSEPSASSASWQRQTATAAVDVASAFQLLTDADSIVIDTDASGLNARIVSAPTRFWGLYGTTVLGGGALYQVAYVENAATYGTDKFRRVTVKDFDELSVLIDSLTNIKISGTSDTDGCHLTFTVSDTSVACVGGWFRIHADMTSSDGKSASLDRVIPVIVNKTGSAGLNAVNISLSPSSVILTQTYNSTTHASAIDYSGATTTVMGTYGAMSIPAAISSITASGCTAAYDGNKVTVSAVSDGVISAYVDITTTAGGVTQVLRFVIYVNYLGTWWSETYNDFNGRYASKTMVNKDGDTVNVTDLLSSVEQQANSISESVSEVNKQADTNTQNIAALTITSKNISLKVAETQTGRHNLLSGSAFRRKEEFTYNAEAYFPTYVAASCSIQKNAGYHGTNAIYINITEDTQRFIGLRWEGISITPGTTYMFSVLVKSPDITSFTQGAGIELRVNPSGANKSFSTSIVPSKSGAWEQITWAFTVPDTVLNETTSKNEVPTSVTVMMYIVAAGKLYLCRPMMEQSDTFTGWSLSEKDFDYVGGNILPNSRLLTDLTG